MKFIVIVAALVLSGCGLLEDQVQQQELQLRWDVMSPSSQASICRTWQMNETKVIDMFLKAAISENMHFSREDIADLLRENC